MYLPDLIINLRKQNKNNGKHTFKCTTTHIALAYPASQMHLLTNTLTIGRFLSRSLLLRTQAALLFFSSLLLLLVANVSILVSVFGVKVLP